MNDPNLEQPQNELITDANDAGRTMYSSCKKDAVNQTDPDTLAPKTRREIFLNVLEQHLCIKRMTLWGMFSVLLTPLYILIKSRPNYFTSKRMAYLGVFAALSMVLYNWASFSMPGFPVFLSFDFSNIPILLAGFMLGPVAGVVVVVARFLLKMPFSGTFFIGETSDLILGLTFVLISSIIYKYKRNFKGAILGISLGAVFMIGMAVIINRFFLVYIFVELLFNGSWVPILNMMRAVHSTVTRESFFTYYILFVTIPFNLLTAVSTGAVTLILYKRLQRFVDHIIGRVQVRKKRMDK